MSGTPLDGAEARALLLGSDLSLSGPVVTPAGGALADALRLANAPLATAASQRPGPVRRARVRWRATDATTHDSAPRGRSQDGRASNGGSAGQAHPLSPARQGSERPAAFAVTRPAKVGNGSTSEQASSAAEGSSDASAALLFGHDVEAGLARGSEQTNTGRPGTRGPSASRNAPRQPRDLPHATVPRRAGDASRGPQLPSRQSAAARPSRPQGHEQPMATRPPPPRRRATSPDPDAMLDASLGRLEEELSRVERPSTANRAAAREAARRAVEATSRDEARRARRAESARRRSRGLQGAAGSTAAAAPAAAASTEARSAVKGGRLLPRQATSRPSTQQPVLATEGVAGRPAVALGRSDPGLWKHPSSAAAAVAESPSDAVGPTLRCGTGCSLAKQGAARAKAAAAPSAEVAGTRTTSNGHASSGTDARPARAARGSSAAAAGGTVQRRASSHASGNSGQQLGQPAQQRTGQPDGPQAEASRSRSSSRGRSHSSARRGGQAVSSSARAPAARGSSAIRARKQSAEGTGAGQRSPRSAARQNRGSSTADADAVVGGNRPPIGSGSAASDPHGTEPATTSPDKLSQGGVPGTTITPDTRPGGFIDRRAVLVDRAVQRANATESAQAGEGANADDGPRGPVAAPESVGRSGVRVSPAGRVHQRKRSDAKSDGESAPSGRPRGGLDRTERLAGISALAGTGSHLAAPGRALAAPDGGPSWGSSSDESDVDAAALRMARPGATGRIPANPFGAATSGARHIAGAQQRRGGHVRTGSPDRRSGAGEMDGSAASNGGSVDERARLSSSIESTGYARAFRRMRRMQGQPVAPAPAVEAAADGGARVRWGSPLAETLRSPDPAATARSGFGAASAPDKHIVGVAGAGGGAVGKGPSLGRAAGHQASGRARPGPAGLPEDRARRGLQEVIAATREMVARARASTEARRFAEGTADLDFSMGSTWSAESPGGKGDAADLFSQPAAPGEAGRRAQAAAPARAVAAPVLAALPSRRYARRGADGTASVASSRSARSEVVLRASERRMRSSQALAPESARTRRGPLVTRAMDRSGARVGAVQAAPLAPTRPGGAGLAWNAGLGAGGPPRPASLAGHSAPEARAPVRSRSGSARRYRSDASAPRSTRSRRGASSGPGRDA